MRRLSVVVWVCFVGAIRIKQTTCAAMAPETALDEIEKSLEERPFSTGPKLENCLRNVKAIVTLKSMNSGTIDWLTQPASSLPNDKNHPTNNIVSLFEINLLRKLVFDPFCWDTLPFRFHRPLRRLCLCFVLSLARISLSPSCTYRRANKLNILLTEVTYCYSNTLVDILLSTFFFFRIMSRFVNSMGHFSTKVFFGLKIRLERAATRWLDFFPAI